MPNEMQGEDRDWVKDERLMANEVHEEEIRNQPNDMHGGMRNSLENTGKGWKEGEGKEGIQAGRYARRGE